MLDPVNSCRAEERADVKEGGSSDGESLLAVPNNVPLVWTQALVGELWQEGWQDNTHQIFHTPGISHTTTKSQCHEADDKENEPSNAGVDPSVSKVQVEYYTHSLHECTICTVYHSLDAYHLADCQI